MIDDKKALAASVDQLVSDSIFRKGGAAGATIAIVRNGVPLLIKGYGLADARARRPVDGSRTMFRIGSMSKLFTATAVMQLVERGGLDLEADVNEYLEPGLRIPRTFPQPVTLKNLLTHTAGFEENQLGYMVKRSAAELVPLGRHLALHMPARVRPPTIDFDDGRGASYSNWGLALAGHIVARRSGTSFDEYVERNIFEPLGMVHSTFREPLPCHLEQDMSKGYAPGGDGALIEQPFEFFHSVGPAGSMSASAGDMARFMIAHLQDGAFAGRRVLKAQTAKLMQSRILNPHPLVNGAGLAFYECNLNGRRLVGHQGMTVSFPSQLVLLPEENLGVFIAVNSRMPPSRLHRFVKAFMDRYFPAAPSTPAAIREGLERYAGSYFAAPHSHRKNEKFLLLANPEYEMKVTPTQQQTLRISNLSGEHEWTQIAPGAFRQHNAQEVVAFVEDARGEISHMVGPWAFVPAYKLDRLETPEFHRALLGFAAAGFQDAVDWGQDIRAHQPRGLRSAHSLAAAVAGLNLAGLGLIWQSFAGGGVALVYEYPDAFRTGLNLIAISTVLTATLVHVALRAWRRRAWSLRERTQFTAFAMLAVTFLWSLNCWNLIGHQFV